MIPEKNELEELLLRQEIVATIQRARNVESSEMEIHKLLPPKWFVERIINTQVEK